MVKVLYLRTFYDGKIENLKISSKTECISNELAKKFVKYGLAKKLDVCKKSKKLEKSE